MSLWVDMVAREGEWGELPFCVVAFSRTVSVLFSRTQNLVGEIGVIVKIVVTDFYSYVQRQMVYV